MNLAKRIAQRLTRNGVSVLADVTDTNHRPRGKMSIMVDFHQGEPVSIEHEGVTYCFSGKTGQNRDTGEEVRELKTEPDARRLWVNKDCSKLWED